MNAPNDENPDAYLRTIYIFVCRRMTCIRLHSPGALKAFRTQLSEQEAILSEATAGSMNSEPGLAGPFNEWELFCDEEPPETKLELETSG